IFASLISKIPTCINKTSPETNKVSISKLRFENYGFLWGKGNTILEKIRPVMRAEKKLRTQFRGTGSLVEIQEARSIPLHKRLHLVLESTVVFFRIILA
ncbi:MAG: hypothetical protein RR328_06365, partial [Bacteroidales bacterium]